MSIAADSLEDLARELAGNHRNFESFGWGDRPADDENWTIIYTRNRDSGTLDQSNAAQIDAVLEKFPHTARPEHHTHWAVGWVDGWSIRVYTPRGKITRAFQAYYDLRCRLEDYPVLDEEDYSQRQVDEQEESWENWARRDFESALEKAFDCQLDTELADLRQLWDTLCDRSHTYWVDESSGQSINVQRVADSATADDVRPFVHPQAVRLFCNGNWRADGILHLDELHPEYVLDGELFDRLGDALSDGAESFQTDEGLITWELGQ